MAAVRPLAATLPGRDRAAFSLIPDLEGRAVFGAHFATIIEARGGDVGMAESFWTLAISASCDETLVVGHGVQRMDATPVHFGANVGFQPIFQDNAAIDPGRGSVAIAGAIVGYRTKHGGRRCQQRGPASAIYFSITCSVRTGSVYPEPATRRAPRAGCRDCRDRAFPTPLKPNSMQNSTPNDLQSDTCRCPALAFYLS
jgi:hypothetical protein